LQVIQALEFIACGLFRHGSVRFEYPLNQRVVKCLTKYAYNILSVILVKIAESQ